MEAGEQAYQVIPYLLFPALLEKGTAPAVFPLAVFRADFPLALGFETSLIIVFSVLVWYWTVERFYCSCVPPIGLVGYWLVCCGGCYVLYEIGVMALRKKTHKLAKKAIIDNNITYT